MSKAVITIEDDEGKTKINVEFDPPLKEVNITHQSNGLPLKL